jgi:TPR repeat protein
MRPLAIVLAALGAACAHETPRAVVTLPAVVSTPAPRPRACLPSELAACRDIGRRVLPADPRRAFQFESLACDGGVVEACGDLGWMMMRGVWGESNPARALVLLDGACGAGVVASCVTLGVYYRDVRHDDAKAAAVFAHYCDDVGAPDACDELGRMVERGRGFAPDEGAARRLYESACERGAMAGCGDLGRVLLGVDDARAHALLGRACRLHDGHACYELALLTAPHDRARARFERACNLGVAAACTSVAALVDDAERSPEALWWMNRACDEADASACEHLADRVGSPALRARARSIEGD